MLQIAPSVIKFLCLNFHMSEIYMLLVKFKNSGESGRMQLFACEHISSRARDGWQALCFCLLFVYVNINKRDNLAQDCN